jgi:hypothetical protein
VSGFSLVLLDLSAKAHLQADQVDPALDHLAHAVELSDRSDVGWRRPEIERMQAMTLLRSGQIGAAAALSQLERAVALARHQGSATQGWRALIDLAQLRADHGQADRASDLLRDAIASAPGDCDVAELTQIRFLLAGMG